MPQVSWFSVVDEAASITLYSMEIEPAKHCFYRLLNETLKNNEREMLEPWFAYLRLFTYSLEKLPTVKSEFIYRGVTNDVSEQYSKGLVFTWREFSLCSGERKSLEGVLGNQGPRTIFKIDCHTGKEIRTYSCFRTDDNQILLPAGSRFEVISIKGESRDLRLIHLRQLSSSTDDQVFQETIDRCSTGVKVDLLGRQLGDRAMPLAVKQVIENKRVTVLDLRGNGLTAQAALIVGNALGKMDHLERLYFGGNHLGEEGARCLALSVADCKLWVLGLSQNGINDRGAAYLAEMLKKNRQLTVLGLEDNDIASEGVEQLANGLEQNGHLLRLLLARNKGIGDSSLPALIGLLRNNESLQRLDLRGCSLSGTVKTRLQQVANRKKKFELWLE